MTITDGGTGGHITGDNVVIDNAGSTTVSGADATALYIEGDNALVINEGNQTISGGASVRALTATTPIPPIPVISRWMARALPP